MPKHSLPALRLPPIACREHDPSRIARMAGARSPIALLAMLLGVTSAVLFSVPGCSDKPANGASAQQSEGVGTPGDKAKQDEAQANADDTGFVAMKTADESGKLPSCCAEPGSEAAKNTPNMNRMAVHHETDEKQVAAPAGAMAMCDSMGMPSRAGTLAQQATQIQQQKSEAVIAAADKQKNSQELITKVGSIQISQDPDILQTIIGRKIDLNLDFVNQDGKKINLARDFAGRTLVVSSIFTSCPSPDKCPRVTSDFAQFAREIPESLKDKIQFVLVSFDPARDTPQVLKIFGQKHGIDYANTDLVTSDIETIKKLILDELEIPIEIDPQTNAIQNHVMMLHIIDPEGRIVVERAAQSSAKLATVVQEAIRAATMKFVAPGGMVEGANEVQTETAGAVTSPSTPEAGG